MTAKKIDVLRKKIDKIDANLLKLIQERGDLAHQIGDIKSKALINKGSFYKPDRESVILRKILSKNKGLISNKKVRHIFKELISACLSLEEILNIAFLGPTGTHSEAAVINHFGSSVQKNPRVSIDDVFHQIRNGISHFGVVPLENSSEGVVNSTLNCLTDENVLICGETYLDIHHNLASHKHSKLKNSKVVASHPQAFGQCSRWLEKNLPNVLRKVTLSTAEAAEFAKKNKNALCIASEVAIEKYKLKTLVRNIEDFTDNRTRFIVVGNQNVNKTGKDKTSFLFQTPNKPGSLMALLKPFHKRKINLHRIETRPSRKSIDSHNFFIDSEGHQSESKLKQTIAELRELGVFVRILGSYPDES